MVFAFELCMSFNTLRNSRRLASPFRERSRFTHSRNSSEKAGSVANRSLSCTASSSANVSATKASARFHILFSVDIFSSKFSLHAVKQFPEAVQAFIFLRFRVVRVRISKIRCYVMHAFILLVKRFQ